MQKKKTCSFFLLEISFKHNTLQTSAFKYLTCKFDATFCTKIAFIFPSNEH